MPSMFPLVNLRYFEILCSNVDVVPSTDLFFFFFEVDSRSLGSPGWVELAPRPSRERLSPYQGDPEPRMARRYFRLVVHPAYPSSFTKRDGKALLPFYWTKRPKPVANPSKAPLSARENFAFGVLARLPRLSCAELLGAAAGSKILPRLGFSFKFSFRYSLDLSAADNTFLFLPFREYEVLHR